MKAWRFCILAAALSACARAPAPSQITKIVLSRTECAGVCTFAQYTITPDRRVTYTNGRPFTWYGRLDPKTYQAVTEGLTRVPAFGRLSYGGADSLTTIWTEYGGTHAQVSFPTGAARGDASKLEGWARFASAVSVGAVMREREPFVKRVRQLDRLERVVFMSGGCFGTCPAYSATFYADGRATLRRVRYLRGVPRDANAELPFSRVTNLLAASAFASLQPEYPRKWIDGYGVSFEFDYRGGLKYAVLAPDETQWPPPLAELAGAFAQLIRDTDWSATSAH